LTDQNFKSVLLRVHWSYKLRRHSGGYCYGKFPFNFKLFRSVLALSVAIVAALSARCLAWLIRIVCVLAVYGGQLVSGFVWKRVYFGLTDEDEVI